MQVDDADYNGRHIQGDLFRKTYREVLEEKNRLIATYRSASSYHEDLQSLRNNIDAKKAEALETLDEILLEDFKALKIKFEQAQLTGKSKKRFLTRADIKALKPFHWGYEFDEILQHRGGFDAIITNPPWEIFKPQAREFFVQHNDLVKKSKMNIKTFEEEQEKLLKDSEVSAVWLEYLSQFPHVSAYYRSSKQYKNQISIVNGKKAGTDINLYKLFLEQCFNLLRSGGRCGIIVPTGVYTDLGTKQLREMLFSQSNLDTLFGLSNERFIFEGVDHRFKFCLLAFEKGKSTDSFKAAFRIDPREAIRVNQLDTFLNKKDGQVEISVSLVRRLSPDSLSVMEFKSELDIRIAEKMLKFPLLGEQIKDKWNLRLTSEFHMTNDSYLFKQQPDAGRLPLYEGKMIHQFTHMYAEPRYWVDEQKGRKALLKRNEIDNAQKLDYQSYRLGFRDVSRTTDIRTMIAGILPPNLFAGNTLIVSQPFARLDELLFAISVLNSFACDFVIRQKVSAHCNMFYVYQLPVPRLGVGDRFFNDIVERAAKLICTKPEFDELAQEVGLGSHEQGVTDEGDRAKLRAELDGMIAHLYGLTQEEFAYILTTFPVVYDSVKQAALEAYHTFAPLSGEQEVVALIIQGESNELEFKVKANQDKSDKTTVVEAVAAFLNTAGGTLLIGVADDKSVVGLQQDYETLGRKKNRDGYKLFLTNLLLDRLGDDCGPLIQVTFHEVEGKDVCRVTVQLSPRPVYVEEHLFIRADGSKRKLTAKEAIDYSKDRWR